MRITKKAVSIVLAIMMVASMMAVGVVSASAATHKVKTAQALLDKVASAASGDTIQLSADIDFSGLTTNRNAHDSGDELKIDLKNLTLDLNGKKITTVNASVVFTGNGAVIKNGSFALNHVKADGVTYQAGSYGLCIDGYGVENGITLTDLTVEGGINIWDADVDIYNVTATATESNFYAIWAEGNSNVVVNSGTFSDNGSANARGPIATEKSGTGTLVTVKGGTFNATVKVVNAAAPDSVKFEGGTTTKAVPAAYCADGFEPKNNGDGTYGVDCPYEAEVNGTQYASLQDAIDAASSGDTVTLLANIDFSKVTTNRNAHDSGDELKIDLKDLTLDMNDHTITSVNASVVYTGNGATIENGNFALKHVKADGTTYQAGSYGICIDGYGVENSITLNDLTVEGGINIWDADVEINTTTATATASNFYAIWAEGNSNVTVNSGTFSDNGNSNARGPIAADTTTPETLVTVKGGTFNATNKIVNAAASGSVKFEGGTFSEDVPVEYLDNTKDVVETSPGVYEVVDSANTYVARVGDNRYTSIADAIAEIDTTGTVTVLASHSSGAFSVPAAKTITLDLGGYTITGSVTNSGTLTVKNGTLAGTSVVIRNAGGTVNVDEDATVTASAAAAYLGYSAGVLNMNGTMEAPDDVIVVQAHAGTKANIAGTVTATNNGTALLGMGPVEIDLKDGANVTGKYGANIQRADPVGPTVTIRDGAYIEGTSFGITGNGNAGNGKTTINILGGTVKGGTAGIYHPQEGQLNISGGTVEGYDGIYMRSGTANITGGTIKGTGAQGDHEDSSGGAQLTGDAFAVDNSDYPGGAPVVSITGGTFISEHAKAVASYSVTSEGVLQTPIKGFVSDGLFSDRVDADLCAENYFPVSSLSEEGMYVVKSVDDTNTPMASIDDENDFGLACDYLNGAILGVQMKNAIDGAAETSISGQENGNDIRFIAVIDTEILNSAEDYGFVVAKADDKKEVGGVNVDRTCANTNFDGMKYNGGNGEKTLTAVGTNNNVCGNAVYGNPADKTTDYKYVTCAINGVESGKKIVARFYIKVNGKVYYTNYTNDQNQTYTGCVAGVKNGSIY